MKRNKNLIVFLSYIFLAIFCFNKSLASEGKTFLSLKNNEVNVRIGPSKKYPVQFTYKKKYLPLEILDKFDNWRKKNCTKYK